jgi:hypothetical protein
MRRTHEKDEAMNGWVAIVVRRLLSDDEFRAEFLRDPDRAIEDIVTPDARLTRAPGRRATRLEAADTQPDALLAE